MLLMCLWMFIQACVSYLSHKALMATNEDPVAMAA